MVGITKRQSNNTKKTGIALAQGKKKQLFKKKTVKPITDNFEVESMEVGTSPVIVKKTKKLSKHKERKVRMNADTPHRATVVKPEKVNRSLLPLKPTSVTKLKKIKNVNVVAAQPISKKKAKKIMKAQRQLIREKEEKDKKMQM